MAFNSCFWIFSSIKYWYVQFILIKDRVIRFWWNFWHQKQHMMREQLEKFRYDTTLKKLFVPKKNKITLTYWYTSFLDLHFILHRIVSSSSHVIDFGFYICLPTFITQTNPYSSSHQGTMLVRLGCLGVTPMDTPQSHGLRYFWSLDRINIYIV